MAEPASPPPASHAEKEIDLADVESEKNVFDPNAPSTTAGGEFELDGKHLGTTQLMLEGHIILHPQPSSDPNDPLNYSTWYKRYVVGLMCYAAFLSQFPATGPDVAIIQLAKYYTGIPPNIAKTAYFFSATGIAVGVSNFVWIPLMNKYGRRPIYIFTLIGYCAGIIWAAVAKTYASELAARLFMCWFSGGTDVISPVILTDINFLHKRAAAITGYTLFMVSGTAIAILIEGGMMHKEATITQVREFYWLSLGLVGLLTLLVVFTLPETAFRRVHAGTKIFEGSDDSETSSEVKIPRKTYWQSMAVFTGTYTSESLMRMAVRPLLLIFFPAVVFGFLIFGYTLGFFIALSTNYSVSFAAAPYHFKTTHIALLHIANVIASLLAVPFTTFASDWVVNYMTRRNNGVFQPEYRLIMMIPGALIFPAGLLMWGFGIAHKLSWIVPCLGSAFVSFSMVILNNCALVYPIDVYKPISGEVITAVLGYKAFFAFGMSFYTNPWISKQGYVDAFGEMAGITVAISALCIPLYFFGPRMREASISWTLTRWIGWDSDRDDIVHIAKH